MTHDEYLDELTKKIVNLYKIPTTSIYHHKDAISDTSGVGVNMTNLRPRLIGQSEVQNIMHELTLSKPTPTDNDWWKKIITPNPCGEMYASINKPTAIELGDTKVWWDEFTKGVEPSVAQNNKLLIQGVAVRPNKDHADYQMYKDQHRGNNGVVTEEESNGWVTVRWSHGTENTYSPAMLDIIGGEESMATLKKKVVTSMPPEAKTPEGSEQYKLPILAGMRVCLNPESDGFRDNNAETQGTAGWVTASSLSDTLLAKWKDYTDRQKADVVIYIMFDNSRSLRLRMKHLLLVETPPRTITKYHFSNGDERTVIDGTDAEKAIDTMVFNRKMRVEKRIVYDDAYRKKIMDSIAKHS